jgi:hypothetical protein
MTDPNTTTRQLPLLPHPDHLRKQAKARLATLRSGAPDSRLADAQRALAREYGFATWSALQAEVTLRASSPAARQIRTRRRGATLHLGKPGGASQRQGQLLPAARRRPLFVPAEDDPFPPMGFLRVGVLIQVCFAVAALIGVGVVFFVAARTPAGLLHPVL